MTLYYAVGGGLGHLRRARRILEALAIPDAAAEIVTSADLPAELEGDRLAHRRWLEERFEGRRVIIDAFPAGIQGELSGLEGTFDYVARLLNWAAYRSAIPFDPPHFGRTFVVEELTEDHRAFIRASTDHEETLTLLPPASAVPPVVIDPGYALVVHSAPASEVEELVAYARELGSEPIVVATQCDSALLPDTRRLDTERPFDYFEGASRIVSAAGFNMMLETATWRHKHHVLPFPRRFDDQFLRASRAREAGRKAEHRATTLRQAQGTAKIAPTP